MKHLKDLNSYMGNINEGINYNDAQDADLADVGAYLHDHPEAVEDNELEKRALEYMKKAKPFPLTGKIKTDAPKLISYIVDAFKKVGVNLDGNNAIVYSPNFANEIEIPVKDVDGIRFITYLDYSEMASNGSNFILSGSFDSEENGTLDYFVSDLSNNREIIKAAEGFKQWLETNA
jgi:hypothetical protein